MPAAIVARTESGFTIQVEIPYRSSMLESEETIQEGLNQAGVLATQEALQPGLARTLGIPGNLCRLRPGVILCIQVSVSQLTSR